MAEIIDSIILDFGPLAAQLRAAADRLEGKATYVGSVALEPISEADLAGIVNATAERIEIVAEYNYGGEPLAPKAEIDSVIDDLNAHTKAYAEDLRWEAFKREALAIEDRHAREMEARIREIVREEIANSPAALERSEGEAVSAQALSTLTIVPAHLIAEEQERSREAAAPVSAGGPQHPNSPRSAWLALASRLRKGLLAISAAGRAWPAQGCCSRIGSGKAQGPASKFPDLCSSDSPVLVGARRMTEAGGVSNASGGGACA